jgi:hypothetical protein
MSIKLFILLCLIALVTARGGIGGRIAIYPRTSKSNTLSKLIKTEWECDPFTKCKSQDFDCMLERCPYNQTSGANCPNQIIGQYSSMCLQIGVNDLKKNIFLGKSFSLILEKSVVAKCLKYDIFAHFVSECELFRVNHASDALTEMLNNNEYQNHHRVYYRTTRSILESEKRQSDLMQKQLEFNKHSVEIQAGDFQRIDFEIRTPIVSHRFKVSTASGVSFTLPEGTTEKHALPVYAELNMGLALVDEECFWAYETETRVLIKKTIFCLFKQVFSF